jgi:hypothetical protein
MLSIQEAPIHKCCPSEPSKASTQGAIGSLVKPSLRAIQEQAKLFRDARLSKEWASHHKKLTLKQSGLHDVFPLLGKTTSDEPLTYFKQGDFERYMEVIVWDIAVILGWEDLLTPTKLDKLYVDQLLSTKGKTLYTVVCREEMKGSMQRALQGVVYEKWDISLPLNKRSLHKTFIAMYLLGLNDVHANNLIVQHDGSFRLFDNTKCLPPSNTWILSINEFFPVHRFVLFELDHCYQPLSPVALDEMRRIVTDFRKRLPSLIRYFQSARLAKIEKILPENWLDRGKSLSALIQRLDRLEAALNAQREWSLFNLFEEIYPEYRFAFLITLIYADAKCNSIPDSNEGKFQFTHSCVGGFGLTDIFSFLLKNGYSLPLLQKKASDHSISLRELADWVMDHPDEAKIQRKTEKEKVEGFIEIYNWLKQFRQIPRDYKDTDESLADPQSNREVLSDVCSKYLTALGFGTYQEGSRSVLKAKGAKKHRKPFLYKCLDEKKWYAIYTDKTYEDLTTMIKNRDHFA